MADGQYASFTDQKTVLLQTPLILNALLNIATSRNWLQPALTIMRLHAYLAQALRPGQERLRLAQLPGVNEDAIEGYQGDELETFVGKLEIKGDERASEIRKAINSWGRLNLVDAAFKGQTIICDILRHLTWLFYSYWRTGRRPFFNSTPRCEIAHHPSWKEDIETGGGE